MRDYFFCVKQLGVIYILGLETFYFQVRRQSQGLSVVLKLAPSESVIFPYKCPKASVFWF